MAANVPKRSQTHSNILRRTQAYSNILKRTQKCSNVAKGNQTFWHTPAPHSSQLCHSAPQKIENWAWEGKILQFLWLSIQEGPRITNFGLPSPVSISRARCNRSGWGTSARVHRTITHPTGWGDVPRWQLRAFLAGKASVAPLALSVPDRWPRVVGQQTLLRGSLGTGLGRPACRRANGHSWWTGIPRTSQQTRVTCQRSGLLSLMSQKKIRRAFPWD